MREATTFSRILEMKLRFEIGQQFLNQWIEMVFEKRLDKSLFECMAMKKFLQEETNLRDL